MSSRTVIITFVLLFLILLLSYSILKTKTSPATKDALKSSAQEAARIAHTCNRDDFFETCYKAQFAILAKHYPLASVYDVLTALWDIDKRTRSCHVFAHTIGLQEVEKDPPSWRDILKTIDPQACSGGFFHGILEAHTRFDSSFKIDSKQIEKLCYNPNNSYMQGSCLHIMGHLLLVAYYPNIEKALEFCGGITLPSTECYSGVFMEHMTKQNLAEHGLAKQFTWTEESVKTFEQLCFQYQEAIAKACWGEMGHMYAAVYDDEPSVVVKVCNRVPDESFAQNCYFHAIAKIAVTTSNRSYVHNLCTPYSNSRTQFRLCVKRVVNAMLTSSPNFFQKAVQFCLTLASEGQSICFEQVGRDLSGKVSKDKQEGYCRNVPEKFRQLCTI